jgi:uncharacterized protein YcbX
VSAALLAPRVCGLALTAVKGTRLREVEQIELERSGARGNRRFFVVDEHDRMVNAKQLGELTTIVARYDEAGRTLTLEFPDGGSASGVVGAGAPVSVRFFSTTVRAKLVEGPWSAALTEHVGQPLRLVEHGDGAVDRGRDGAASLISRASLQRLAAVAEEPHIDPRRFRMLIEVDGLAAHGEDEWVGRSAQIGDAVISWTGHVGRCLITSRDPDTGRVDLPTLDLLGSYRRDLDTTEPLPFGIYGAVVRPGTVRVGDSVSLRES